MAVSRLEKKEGKKFMPLKLLNFSRASIDGDFKNFIQLAFCRYDKDILVDGIIHLGQAIKELTR